MDAASLILGNAMEKMIAEMHQMKETFVLRKLVLTSSLLVKAQATVYPNLGNVTETMTVLTTPMKKIVHQLHVRALNSSVRI